MDALPQRHLVQAAGTWNNGPKLEEFLREDNLPDDARLLLSETFKQTEHRASAVRTHISQIKQILLLPALLPHISSFRASPIVFWVDGQDQKSYWETENALSYIYKWNRQNEWHKLIDSDPKNDVVHAMRRAFGMTAIYLLIRSICSAFGAKIFSQAASEHCLTLIATRDADQTTRENLEQVLRKDYQAGKRWDNYATRLGGSGVFFLIGIVPPSAYEGVLNQGDDLDFVASQYQSLKVPEIAQRHDLYTLGDLILSEITERAWTCSPPNLPVKKRKYSKKKAVMCSGGVSRRAEHASAPSISGARSKRVRYKPNSLLLNQSGERPQASYKEPIGLIQHPEAPAQPLLAHVSTGAPTYPKPARCGPYDSILHELISYTKKPFPLTWGQQHHLCP
ncbi:hypothetical protein ASPCAL15089 [Aspergillus calidoustus]|uniref:Uncharacterized protein n=1 Tax=Aspergillus calidoustus TaxID=454130 RepID=A0A0U5GIS4_ASPCI|nr:hypothetical protein ASPCAL15089 [Aspergillus calidoustus]